VNGDFHVGPWLVQPSLNAVSHNGTSYRLEPKVMEVLVCLASHPGEPLSKEQLLSAVWPHTFVSDDVLIRSISELRRVLEDNPKEPRFIQTIPKRGYRLVMQVARTDGSSAELTLSDNTCRASSDSAVRAVIAIGAVTLLLGVLTAWKASDLRGWMRASSDLPPVHSLAVLPLKNLSGDAAQEYLADGMTDELITYLSQVPGLRVISYTSVVPYKDSRKSLPAIAGELVVDGVVEGSVQRLGDRVRVNAQLIYASQDTNVWAQSYDRDFKDALALQSTLADAMRAARPAGASCDRVCPFGRQGSGLAVASDWLRRS
jgi:transcriptional activator of cad operon